ncbi:alpha/beta hydrolase [Cryobacterium sp. SO2]|uniref:alpha/beta fold hydrolase n=1 Tax=Cryobacterium sp. SO2 TaxID=1897060 RepID=UPI0023D9917D|nr:alpha/beta hydrolase [Cryobacterium sp. SO2]WEO75883.1 alpha/beta hydrolase [Cryobacterium sp. SO2]
MELYLTDKGGDGPPVVLLHGLAGSGTEMAQTAAALRDHRVITLDARGHGRSTTRPDDVSRAAHTADVVFVIETVIGQPVALVGQSMGGHTALLVASARPDLVGRLVLLEAGVGGDGTFESREALRGFFDSWPIPFATTADARAFLGDSVLSRAWIDDLEGRADGLWPRFDPEVLVETLAHVDAHPHWAEWCSLDVPTLAVFGAVGMFSPVAQREFVSRGRKVRHVTLDEGSHDAHLDAFDSWIRELSAFLALCPTPPGDSEQRHG